MINLKDKVIITGATGDIGKLSEEILSLGSMIIATELTKKLEELKNIDKKIIAKIRSIKN